MLVWHEKLVLENGFIIVTTPNNMVDSFGTGLQEECGKLWSGLANA